MTFVSITRSCAQTATVQQQTRRIKLRTHSRSPHTDELRKPTCMPASRAGSLHQSSLIWTTESAEISVLISFAGSAAHRSEIVLRNVGDKTWTDVQPSNSIRKDSSSAIALEVTVTARFDALTEWIQTGLARLSIASRSHESGRVPRVARFPGFSLLAQNACATASDEC